MGWLTDAEKAHPGETVRRATGSALWSRMRGGNRSQSVALVFGANSLSGADWTRSVGVEALHDAGALQFFTRAEVVEKSDEELVLHDEHGEVHSAQAGMAAVEEVRRVGHLTLGALLERPLARAGRIGLGVRGTLNVVPATLEQVYGSRTPLGMAVFVRWRPSRMQLGMDHASMGHGAGRPPL